MFVIFRDGPSAEHELATTVRAFVHIDATIESRVRRSAVWRAIKNGTRDGTAIVTLIHAQRMDHLMAEMDHRSLPPLFAGFDSEPFWLGSRLDEDGVGTLWAVRALYIWRECPDCAIQYANTAARLRPTAWTMWRDGFVHDVGRAAGL
jgi:hypothetical protein